MRQSYTIEQNDMKYENLIRAFYLAWDRFPGLVWLIDKGSYVLAVSQATEAAGVTAGQICVKMGFHESCCSCFRYAFGV